MAVRIRLNRMGANKQPFYRLVVAESRSPRDGRFIGIIGHYNPTSNLFFLRFGDHRALHWLLNGAKPSDTARALLKGAGILEKYEEAKKAKVQ